MKKITTSLFFVILIILFNTCESPKEPDIIPPTINITYPNDNDTIYEVIIITTEVADNDKIAKVWFAINDTIGEDRKITSAPWQYQLNTSGYSDSSKITIRAVVFDEANNETISDLITVWVDNTTYYPNNLAIESIEYNLEKMTATWEQSDDEDFKKYNLLYSPGTNEIINADTIYTSYSQDDTSYSITSFDPKIKNWFWIQVLDQANLSTLSLSNSNTIDLPPSQINNITVFYEIIEIIDNDTSQVLNIAWVQSNDWDFKSYQLEHRENWSDEWNIIWTSESISDNFFQSAIDEFIPSNEEEIVNWFKMAVTDHWGQFTSSPEFNDADQDGPPLSSNIISVNYDTLSMTINWEQTQEDLIEFSCYNLYYSTSETDSKELIYSTTDDCRDFNSENECISADCIWENNQICHNNSILETSWTYNYLGDYTNYSPIQENWFWIGVFDERGAETIGQGLSNNIELPPESINITSLNSENISNEAVNINVTWEQSNDIDFSYYTLYKSDYTWASATIIEIFDNIYTNSFSEIITIDQTVDNWFWITSTDIWDLESNIGDGMMISSVPMPEAVNVDSVKYNINKMTIFWDQTNDDNFNSYQIYKADSSNGQYNLLNQATISNQEQDSFNLFFFDPTIENWFKIKTTDNLDQYSFGSSKSNEIDPLPEIPILNIIQYNNQQFFISWEKNSDQDFINYSLFESYNYDMSNASLIQNFNTQSDTSFTRSISDNELEYGEGLLFYQLAVNDFWNQVSYSNISVGSNHIKFVEDYGGSSYDFIFSVIAEDDGYITSGINNNLIWILETTLEGIKRFEEFYDFSSGDNTFQGIGESDKSMMPTSDGGYILTGHTRHLGSDMDAFLMKFNPALDLSWSNFYCGVCNNDASANDNRNDRGVSVIEASDGGYIFTGNINDLNNGKVFIWVLKTNSNGEVIWNTATSLPNSSLYDNTGYSLIESDDLNYIVIGNVENSGSSTDIWLNKLNSNDGSTMWGNGIFFGGVDIDEAYTINETNDGNYLIAGATRSMGNGGYDGWVIKIDQNGTVLWDQTYGGSANDKIYSVVESDDGSKLTFCGYTRSYNSQNDDIWILQIDSNGNEIFNKTIGGNLFDKSYSIKNASDGGFIISGNTSSISDNGDLQAVLIKTDPQGNTENFE